MSTAMPSTIQSPDVTSQTALQTSIATFRTGIRAVAFWAAVLLPFVTFITVASGLVTSALAMLGLVGANITSAIVGHDYSRYP